MIADTDTFTRSDLKFPLRYMNKLFKFQIYTNNSNEAALWDEMFFLKN